MVAWDMSDEVSYPVPPGALPSDGERTIDLPGPGCWMLDHSGEGCSADARSMVEASCGELVEWTLRPDDHVCIGG